MVLPFSPELLPPRLRDPRVLAALERVPRAEFVPEDERAHADRDVALPIGFGQTISQPFIVAYMTAGLEVGEGDRVLEIGTGSGYQAAILAELGARVFSLEVVPELVELARENLARVGLADRVSVRFGDGWHGWPGEAPFRGIICTAAPERVPTALIEQLEVGGRLVIPVGPAGAQVLYVYEKTERGLYERDRLDVRFVPLVRPKILA